MSARIDPAVAPFSQTIQIRLDQLMPPDVPPLRLFTMLARDERLFVRFMDGGLLDTGNLSLRHREIVIDRVTANCRCEYEWGVHVVLFAARAGLTQPQLCSLACGNADDPCWQEASERVLIRVCDALHAQANVDDDLWVELSSLYSEEACLEVLMLAGFYRTVSYLANATRLPLEPYAARFPTRA
ncbi:carboxymuconolactone decarboxylase family protein [Nitratireductor sp. CAU 1489]|uniref:Carboxymuconolactone decarboxylase family protein n=1 Tax=Nitratireductor arenosus TaxID=2682096 RepID=A0A844QMC1_9HYPH|nr:carboxymuconolactone decarboxylase family protein [Nitratireductor arenosus]MVA98769.1 carboxymuconolactone decarboxylase family protein [Nitratireductor arenosus]